MLKDEYRKVSSTSKSDTVTTHPGTPSLNVEPFWRQVQDSPERQMMDPYSTAHGQVQKIFQKEEVEMP